jgi:hypothetical protein
MSVCVCVYACSLTCPRYRLCDIGKDVVGKQAVKDKRPPKLLILRLETRLVDKTGKFFIGHRIAVQVEGGDADGACGAFAVLWGEKGVCVCVFVCVCACVCVSVGSRCLMPPPAFKNALTPGMIGCSKPI